MEEPDGTEGTDRTERAAAVFHPVPVVRPIAIAIVLIAAFASVAAATPPWSAPETVSSAALYVEVPKVAFDRAGRGYATWGASGRSRLAVREPGAAEFGPERSSPRFVTPLLAHGATRVLGLDARAGRRPDVVSLRARVSRPDGSFGRPDTISTFGLGGGGPSLAVHDVALAAWSQGGPRGRRIVRAAIRRPGQRFGRPLTLRARGRARHVVSGVGVGAMFVAWERAGIVEARVRLAGSGWGPVRRLGPAARGSTTFRAAFSGRRGYLAWLSESTESAVLRVAVLPTARTRFRPAQTIDNIDRNAPAEPHGPVLVPIAEREATLAWTGWDGTAWRVRTAVTGPGAGFGTFADVSAPGEQAVLGDAEAVSAGTSPPAGTTIVVWSRLDAVGELGDRVRAALRPPGGGFGPPEDVSDLDRARLPDAAFEPALRALDGPVVTAHRPRRSRRTAVSDHYLRALLDTSRLT